MSAVKFKHATLDIEAVIFSEQVFSVLFLPEANSTAVIGPGGAMVYVKETVEEAVAKLEEAKASIKQEKN